MEEREEGEEENEDDGDRLSKSTVSKHTSHIPTIFFFQEDCTTDSHPKSSLPKTLVFYVKLFLSIPVNKTLTLQ